MTSTERIAYNCVRRGLARTRAEISKEMGVSRPTASTVADSLIASGLLCEGGKWRSSGGRNPTLLVVRKDAFSLVGMDLGYRDRVSGVWVDATGKIIRSSEIMMMPDSPARAAEAISRLWERLDPDSSACGIGLALPGKYEPESGTVSDCDLPAFGGSALIKLLRKRFVGKFFHAMPRHQAAAVSEGFGGVADRKKNFLLLSLEDELEAVFYLDGRCVVGEHGSAGDLRSLPAAAYKDTEVMTLGEAFSREVLQKVNPPPDQLATVCACGLRHVLSIIDPGFVVLNGRFRDFDDDFMPLLERRLARFDCGVKLAAFGRYSTSRGAALQAHIGV